MRLFTITGLLAALSVGRLLAQPPSFRYFYDDAGELFRVLDSTGTLIEYDYDLSGNITQIQRSTVPPASLTILNIAPLSGPVGQTVTIYGQNFSPLAAGDVVQFGGVTATVVSASSTVLVVQIPGGFTSGVVTLTVNGVTVNAGSLTFTPPPAVTSISPQSGDAGQAVNVVIQGLNLSGASFSIGSGGTVVPVSTSSTQATVTITPGSQPGQYILVATAPSGATSSSAPSVANTFFVFFPPGENYAETLFSTFNAMGGPSLPAGSNETDQIFSVFNSLSTPGTTLTIPAGANEADQIFSVFNSLSTPGTTLAIPAGSNEADQTFSVFNGLVIPGVTSLIPPGSNEAWQLFSTQNNAPAGSAPPMTVSLAPSARPATSDSPTGQPALGGMPERSLIAGQSVHIVFQPSEPLSYMELDVDGVPLATSATGSLDVLVTAPSGVESLKLRGLSRNNLGTTSESPVQPVRVEPDSGRMITGRVTDANGSPVAGAVVTWEAQGLAAEYFRLTGELSGIPTLRGEPTRVSFLGVLNYPNPQRVFGLDPMGVALGGNYAARLAGKIRADATGLYRFALLAHRGASLTIDGALLGEATATDTDAVTAVGSADLAAGVHDIEVTYFESGGAGALQLLWTPPDGVQALVPPSAITAEAPVSWRAITGSDGRFALRVPAALDGITVKVATGIGSVQLNR